jgi:hypothetical protein
MTAEEAGVLLGTDTGPTDAAPDSREPIKLLFRDLRASPTEPSEREAVRLATEHTPRTLVRRGGRRRLSELSLALALARQFPTRVAGDASASAAEGIHVVHEVGRDGATVATQGMLWTRRVPRQGPLRSPAPARSFRPTACWCAPPSALNPGTARSPAPACARLPCCRIIGLNEPSARIQGTLSGELSGSH